MILTVGNINTDILLPLDRLPGPHEKMSCSEAVTGFGGSAANTAYWLGRLGVRTVMAGAVGSDPAGAEHLRNLREAGVDTRGVATVPGSTGLAVVFSLGREKRMIRVPGANVKAAFDPGLLEGVRVVYLSGAGMDALARYAREAARRGIPVLCGRHGASDPAVARKASGFILNADEVREITGLQDPGEGILALDGEVSAVTLPGGGCLVSRGIDVTPVPSPELDPVDRTGGGDAFAAGFLAGLYRGLEPSKCGRLGNVLAAAVIMEAGARPEIDLPEGLGTVVSSEPGPL